MDIKSLGKTHILLRSFLKTIHHTLNHYLDTSTITGITITSRNTYTLYLFDIKLQSSSTFTFLKYVVANRYLIFRSSAQTSISIFSQKPNNKQGYTYYILYKLVIKGKSRMLYAYFYSSDFSYT